MVAGPQAPFKPDESARLKAYTDKKKGPLLLLVGDTESTGLEDLLKGFNVEVGKGFVIEPRMNYRGRVDPITWSCPSREPSSK